MKFFEIVPRELFSPLASPNRELYVDALDVLYTAYRENLKIRDDTLYSMLRSRLEQQLADATFEGEDIDDIKAKSEALSEIAQNLAVKLYEQANAAQGEAGQATDAQEAPRDDNTFDGDFEESK